MSDLRVYSGECCLCDVGTPVGAKDVSGNDLFTGDIVMVWYGQYLGTDVELWHPSGGLTCVVSDQYLSFNTGEIKEKPDPEPFVMGIKDCGLNHPKWQIHKVKGFSDVVEGERWPEFGFSYKRANP